MECRVVKRGAGYYVEVEAVCPACGRKTVFYVKRDRVISPVRCRLCGRWVRVDLESMTLLPLPPE